MGNLYIGLMSGTSLDGLDAVLVQLGSGNRLTLLATHSQPLPEQLRSDLLALTEPGTDEIRRMGQLHIAFGRFCGQICLELLEKSGVPPTEVTAIGSHGQTVRHHPEERYPFTLQIGDPSTIAQLTGVTTVADFRLRDMAVGGQGAPLVPAFHAALLHKEGSDTAVLNIGGMANLTLLPGNSAQPTLGFDTGPGNVLLDHWCHLHTGNPFDANGTWGASGKVDDELLSAMLAEPFFQLPPPKSTGRELFNPGWLKQMCQPFSHLPAEDVQATLTELTAHSISDAMRNYAAQYQELLVCGGGAYNGLLMQRIEELSGREVKSTAVRGMEPRWMEACAFAWLAQETLYGRSGNLPSVTGASKGVVLGGIYPGSHWPPEPE